MREHQIVISLKPEQFEEVQRMARAAGAKSVSLFLRQKLVSTLGLTKVGAGGHVESSEADLKQVTGELRRLHRELQIFVADSLVNSSYSSAVSAMENAIPFPKAVQENFLAEGAPLMPESMEMSYSENVSIPFSEAPPAMSAPPPMPANPMLPGQVSMALERTPSMFGSSSFSLPTPTSSDDSPDSFGTQSAYAIARDTNQTAQINPSAPVDDSMAESQSNYSQPSYELPPSVGQPPYAIPPTGSAGPSANFAGVPQTHPQSPDPTAAMPNQPVYSIPEPPPDLNSNQSQNAQFMAAQSNAQNFPQSSSMQMPGSQVNSNVSAVPPQIKSFAENDELEELADRAFAISPRLGPLEEPVKRFPDPLKDLLEDALLNGLDDDEEISEPDSELSEEFSGSETSSAEHLEQSDESNAYEDIANSQQDHIEETEIGTVETEIEEFAYDDEPEAENLAEAASEHPAPTAEDTTDDRPPDPPPQFPPPISGGPPPRKRRT